MTPFVVVACALALAAPRSAVPAPAAVARSSAPGAAATTPTTTAQATDDLAACRTLDQNFDTAGMVAPCARAGADPAHAVVERIEAWRLLALAQLVNGDTKAAHDAFLQMLLLQHDVVLPDDVSPRARDALSQVRADLETRGAIAGTIAVTRDGARVEARVVVTDPLGRVANARLLVEAGPPSTDPAPTSGNAPAAASPHEFALTRTEGGFTTSIDATRDGLPDGATVVVELLGPSGAVLPTQERIAAPVPAAPVVDAPVGGELPSWTWLAAAGAGGAVALGVVVGGVWWLSAALAPPAAVRVVVP